MIKYKEKLNLILLMLYVATFLGSILLKINIINYINIVIIVMLFTVILLKNEKLLILTGVIMSILFRGLGNISGFLQYIPIYIYLLMLVDIIIKKKNKGLEIKLKWIVILSIFLSVIPLILNLDINIPNMLYAIMKRYCFIIIYLYVINSNVQYEVLSNIITKPLGVLLVINVPIFIIQFINGTDRDFITGIFGDNMTGIVSQLLMIQICIKLKDFYFKKIKLVNLFFWISISVLYFAISEVKFGFFVIVLFLSGFFIFIKRGFKSIFIIGLLALVMILGYNLYMQAYSKQNFLDIEFVKNYLAQRSYSGAGLNRIGFKSTIDTIVFNNNIDELIGKGIGTGNPSDFKALQGSLYEEFGYLKYNWFLLSYIYVENGMLGIILFICVYIYALLKSYRCYRETESEQSLLVFLITILTLMYLIYNSSILDYTIIFIYWSYFGLFCIEQQHIKNIRAISH